VWCAVPGSAAGEDQNCRQSIVNLSGDVQDSWVLTHLKAKDLLLIQGSPGAVRAPVKPAPPWSAVPFAPHGRIDKVDAPVGLVVHLMYCHLYP
jgi:hypothetical protein